MFSIQRFKVSLLVGASALAFASAPAQQMQVVQLSDAREVFDGRMLPSNEVATFSHSDTLFPTNTVARGEDVRQLLHGSDAAKVRVENLRFQSGGEALDLYDYLADDRVAGLLILKDGKV